MPSVSDRPKAPSRDRGPRAIDRWKPQHQESGNQSEAKPKAPAGLAHFEFLLEQGRLPPYLQRIEDLPQADDAPPTPWAVQARREWPKVAKRLSLPVGKHAANTERGIIIRIQNHLLVFDLDALWRHLNLFY